MTLARAAALAVAVLASAAWAEDAQVPVQADVVFASVNSGTVEPALKPMQVLLSAKVKKNYLTMKTLSAQKLSLQKKPLLLKLPNGKSAELSLQSLKDDVATVQVKVPPTEATSKLARERSLYQHCGAHDGGDLWLVLSQPR